MEAAADRLAVERAAIEAAQRDPARYGEVYRANVAAVFAFVLSRIRDREAAEDITAEVFVKALRALPRFEWRGVAYSSYLVRIADRLLVDRWASDTRAAPSEATATDPFDEVERAERLSRSIARLPPDQRDVVLLRFVEDQPLTAVADALGRSVGAVKQLQFRAITALRDQLDPEDFR